MAESEPLVGRSGLTHREWEDRAIADFMAGRRASLPSYRDFQLEFIADADGMLPPITGIVSAITGEVVELAEPLRIHVDDQERVLAEYQQKFLDEWNARPKQPRRFMEAWPSVAF